MVARRSRISRTWPAIAECAGTLPSHRMSAFPSLEDDTCATGVGRVEPMATAATANESSRPVPVLGERQLSNYQDRDATALTLYSADSRLAAADAPTEIKSRRA
jgi:hypothetical protein